MQSENIGKLADALSKAQGEMKNAVKDSANPFFKSKYADLSSVLEACRAALSKNGLSITQFPTLVDGAMVLQTTLMHASGEWMRGLYPINPVKQDPQGIGSAITYARRYSLASIVGVAQDDDDGETAMNRNVTPQAKDPVKKTEADKVVNDVLEAIANSDVSSINEIFKEYGAEEMAFLWRKFNSKERSEIKRLKNEAAGLN